MLEGAPAQQSSPELSTFVGELDTAVDRQLRRLVGLPDHLPLRWHCDPDAGTPWRLHIQVAGDLELDLFPRAPSGQRMWFEGQHLAAGYRAPASGSEPSSLLAQLRRRLTAMDQRGQTAELTAAVAEHLRFSGIQDWMFRDVSPREAVIRLGFRCNQDCSFCWQDRTWPEPPVTFYERWIDELAATGIRRVSFTGGEPTIHRALLPLVQRARSHGMVVQLQTNAVRLAKPEFAAQLSEAGVSGLFVSFHSHRADVSDAMTRARGTWSRTVRGIEQALKNGLLVDLNCVVEQQNYGHLGDHARFIVDTFVAPLSRRPTRVIYSHPCQYRSEAEWRAGLVPLDVLRPHLLEAIDVLHAANVPVEGIGTCGFPPCLLADRPELQRVFVREAQTDADVAGRVYGAACDGCAMRSSCLGVRREYLDIYGERGLQPFAELPDRARFEPVTVSWAAANHGPIDPEILQLRAGLRQLIKRERATPADARKTADALKAAGFMTRVFVDDAAHRAITFAARDSAALDRAITAESAMLVPSSRSEAVQLLGELLGYPRCCVEAHAGEAEQDDAKQIRRLIAATAGPATWADNWTSHQLRLFSHFPCQTGCLATRTLSHETLALLADEEPRYAEAVRHALGSVALVQPAVERFALLLGARVQRTNDGASITWDDVLSHRTLGITKRDPVLNSERFRDFYRTLVARLESADALVQSGGSWQLAARGKLIGHLDPQTALLDFTG